MHIDPLPVNTRGDSSGRPGGMCILVMSVGDILGWALDGYGPVHVCRNAAVDRGDPAVLMSVALMRPLVCFLERALPRCDFRIAFGDVTVVVNRGLC
jgi:hypothetical protein